MSFREARDKYAEREAHFRRLDKERQKHAPIDSFDDTEDFKLGLIDNLPPGLNLDLPFVRDMSDEQADGERIDIEPEPWELLLSDRYRPVVLFYDPKMHRTTASRKKLLDDARAENPGRQFRLQPLQKEDLARVSISPFALAEEQFQRLGYVNEIEARKFGIGKKYGRPASVATSLAILRTNALLWKEMLKKQYRSLSLCISGADDERGEDFDELAAHILGRRTRKKAPIILEYSKRPRSVPVILHEGLYLGSSAKTNDQVYASTEATPQTTQRNGTSEVARQMLFGSRWQISQEQIAFEFENAGRLFGNGKAGTDAMCGAIVTWFSQVIIAQRRAVWRMQAKTNWSVIMKELKYEKKLYRQIAGIKKLPWRAAPDASLAAPMSDLKATYKGASVIVRMSLEDRILAALNGSMINLPECGEYDYFNNGYHLIAIAKWIGELKRTGEATITQWICRCLELGRDWIDHDQPGNHLRGQFNDATWKAIFNVARSVRPRRTLLLNRPNGGPSQLPKLRLAKAYPVKVRYEWVNANTIANSGTYKRRGRTLTICGPMLCFPGGQHQFWIEKSAVIRQLGGFQFPSQNAKEQRKRI